MERFPWENPTSEANFAPGHGVAQFGLIIDEGHDAQVCLNEEGSLQDQDTIGTTRNWMLFVSFLYCLDKLSAEIVHLREVEKFCKSSFRLNR